MSTTDPSLLTIAPQHAPYICDTSWRCCMCERWFFGKEKDPPDVIWICGRCSMRVPHYTVDQAGVQ